LGGSLADFLSALPHFKLVWDEHLPSQDGSDSIASDRLQDAKVLMITDTPAFSGNDATSGGKRMVFTVSEQQDLWRVVMQGANAIAEIPEIDFEMKPDRRCRIDTIYNVIAVAVFHLSNYVRDASTSSQVSSEDAFKIADLIENLNKLLDLEQPFTFVITDPEGISSIKPADGVHIESHESHAEGYLQLSEGS